MSKTERQKLKLLYLKDYLCQNTDEGHPASADTLLQHLQSKGLSAERKSLYDDIATLNDYGIEILYRRGKPQGYYATHRDFALSELEIYIENLLAYRNALASSDLQALTALLEEGKKRKEEVDG